MKTTEYVDDVCKIGKGAACCRYLAAGPQGFMCLKLTEQKRYLDGRVATGTMNAQGDNCPGQHGVIKDTRKQV